jgi:hypothetical protein
VIAVTACWTTRPRTCVSAHLEDGRCMLRGHFSTYRHRRRRSHVRPWLIIFCFVRLMLEGSAALAYVCVSVRDHGHLSRHAKTRRRVSSTPDLKQALELSRRAMGIVSRSGADRARLGIAVCSLCGEVKTASIHGICGGLLGRHCDGCRLAAWSRWAWHRVRAKVFYKSDARWTGRRHVDRPWC